jgi:hypothetical protein
MYTALLTAIVTWICANFELPPDYNHPSIRLVPAAQITFLRAGAREKLAYAAQDKWLNLFGRNLSTEFQIDAFTLNVSTACL